jgi:hypothetical protein
LNESNRLFREIECLVAGLVPRRRGDSGEVITDEAVCSLFCSGAVQLRQRHTGELRMILQVFTCDGKGARI